jgi:hypothetical protein
MEMNKMSRTKSLDAVLENADEKVAIENMPLETLRDYRLYNDEARRLNKKLKECRYPIKQCPVELHPTQRVAVCDNAQPNNPVVAYLSNDLIHYDKKLTPNKEYDLPQCIVNYLAEKFSPKWGYVNLADGTRETRMVNKIPRFSIRQVFE